jgi:hypothetical protein
LIFGHGFSDGLVSNLLTKFDILATFTVGAKQDSSALPAFDLRGTKGKAGETLALPLQNQTLPPHFGRPKFGVK